MHANEAIQSLTKSMLVDGFDSMIVDLDKCEGSYLYNSLEDKKYLDMFCYFASAPLAYNHPKTKLPEYEKKLLRAAQNNPTNSDIYTVEMADFVETFRRVLMPEEFTRVFFIAGGALAIENALKAAIDWKVRKNIAAGKTGPEDKPEKLGSKIIHFVEAFHGRTGYTMSLTRTADPAKYLYFPRLDWPKIPNPKLRFPITDEVLTEVEAKENEAMEALHKLVKENPDNYAALIIEPIQGEGGDNHFRAEFLRKLRAFTLEHEIMLICDEVQAGVGLTGKTWAHQHFGFVPDMVCFGKKTQVCGFMSTSRIDEVPDNVFHMSSRINSTWGGNLVDMVRCQRYLEIIEEDDLVNHAGRMGCKFLEALGNLSEKHDGLISNIRGRGLMIAFDLPSAELRDEFFKAMLHEQVIVLKSGVHSIRFRPHLDVTEEEMMVAMNAADKVLANMAKGAMATN